MGSSKRPFYRVVVADQRSPRDGRFIEIIGKYHPLSDPSVIEIDEARALHWLMVGAQPSDQVRNLMSKVGIWDRFVAERPNAVVAATPRADRPERQKLSKKAQAKAEESTKAHEAPEVAADAEAAPQESVPALDAPPEAEAVAPSAEEPSAPEPPADEVAADEPPAEEPSEG